MKGVLLWYNMCMKKLFVLVLFIFFITVSIIIGINTKGVAKPITFYGILMLSYLMVKMLLSYTYRPYKKPFAHKSACVLLPVYNENPALLRQCIESLLKQTYPVKEIVVVDDGSDSLEAIHEVEKIKKIYQGDVDIHIFKLKENKGKRNAQIVGVERSSAEFFITVDSDCKLEHDAIYELMKPFNDPKVYAVSGHVIAINRNENILTTLIDMRYENAFRVERAAQSVTGNILVCSGPLSAYRREVIIDNLEHYRNQMFLGSPVVYGDDRCLTNYAIAKGKTVYQSTSVCETEVPATLKKFLRQQLRWNKSFFRESINALRIGLKKPNVFIWVMLELSLWVLFAISLILMIIFRIKNYALIMVLYSLTMSFVMAYTRNVFYVLRNPIGFLLAPVYSIIHTIFLIPLRIWALCTLNDKKWGTR